MTSMFQKQDGDIQAAIQTIDEHTSTMRSCIQQAQQIDEDVARAFQSGASTTFQNKITEWVDSYNQIMQAANTLREKLTSANTGFDSAHEDATQTASSLTTTVSSGLAG